MSATFNHQLSIPRNYLSVISRDFEDRVYSRFVKTFPCVAAYMSSLAIMAVAIDRYELFC